MLKLYFFVRSTVFVFVEKSVFQAFLVKKRSSDLLMRWYLGVFL